MIKAVIFDVDGVILESVDIKTNAFGELFNKYAKHKEAIVAYHKQNLGISRYVKFRYIYERILGLPLSKKLEKQLGKRFSDLVLRKVLRSSLVPGALKFLRAYHKKYFFFIASGTPVKELKFILKQKKLDKFFRRIYGSPKQKTDILLDILSRGHFKKKEVVFVGDASTDYQAARQTGVHFIFREASLYRNLEVRYRLKNLEQLSRVIARISMNT